MQMPQHPYSGAPTWLSVSSQARQVVDLLARVRIPYGSRKAQPTLTGGTLNIGNKIMPALAAIVVALSGAVALAGTAAHASARSCATVNLRGYISTARAFGWSTHGGSHALTIDQNAANLVMCPALGQQGEYYFHTESNKCLFYAPSTALVTEESTRCEGLSNNEVFIFYSGSHSGQYLIQPRSTTTKWVGFWGPPKDGNLLRVNKAHHNYYRSWAAFGSGKRVRIPALPHSAIPKN
jgi:hypothetical protein